MYFLCTILHKVSDVETKRKKFNYIVDAMTYTEAEANCLKVVKDQCVDGDYSIDKIAKTNICDTVNYNDDEMCSKWINIQYGIMGLDEVSGDEIVASKYEDLIHCRSIDEAVKVVKERNQGSDLVALSSKVTNIVEVYTKEKLDDIVI